MIDALPLLLGPEGYQISRSVRLRSSASAYFSKFIGTASNRKTFTFSGWVKKAIVGSSTGAVLFCSTDNSTSTGWLHFNAAAVGSADTLTFQDQLSNTVLVTTQLFRDPSAWYHIIVAIDTTQATASDRAKLYVNGTQVTAFSTATYPALNADTNFTRPSPFIHTIGTQLAGARYFDGYLAEINFIDGQALTPSSFGETNAVTGVWQPKKYAGTYGTNGFYLNFSDNSGVTATTIGKDNSGNSNNWTPNNISVTAGATYDSMIDVPTPYADGGNGRGNYAVLNVLSQHASNVTTLSGGNLNVSGNGCLATISMPSGKWYWEATCTSADADQAVGILDIVESNTGAVSGTINPNRGVIYQANTNVRKNGTIVANYATFTNGDVLGLTFDASNNQIAFYKNNTLQGTITADAPIVSYVPHAQTLGGAFSYNFGQRPFTYTPPTGFLALNTQNLPAPTISNGASYMAATLYTGTGASQNISNAVNGISMQPDLVWIKRRNAAYDHDLFDAVRGAGLSLYSSTTAAEGSGEGQDSFNTNGFTVSGNHNRVNISGGTFAAWQWNAGGSTVTNTSGSISAQVRANPTAGFSVVTWTGTGANATVGHGLGVAPKMMILINRDTTHDNIVWHTAFTATERIYLNLTNAKDTGAATSFNSTLPSSSVISLGSNLYTNGSTNKMVAYCFAEVAGYSAFGKYTGNGSADGPFVYTGFRPRYIMVKRTDSTGAWEIYDSSRGTYNVQGPKDLMADSSGAENASTISLGFDFLSNGIKCRDTTSYLNTSSGTYIYMAFAESPFKTSLAR